MIKLVEMKVTKETLINFDPNGLSGADLSEADLSETEWNDETIWPDGFMPTGAAERRE